MRITINKDALKAKFKKEQAARDEKSSRGDISKSLMVKVSEKGKHKFRAVPYIHNDDPSTDPFAIRAYHYIPGSGTVYCPQENAGEDCHLCDYIWSQMVANKATPSMNDAEKAEAKKVVKTWGGYLPRRAVFLPGVIRGREEEGAKFLRMTTYKDKMSDRHAGLWEFFFSEEEDEQNWMDPDVGSDLVLKYTENDEAKARQWGPFSFDGYELARKASPFSKKKGGYEAFLKAVPNLDETKPFTKVDTAYTLEVLQAWSKKLGKSIAPAKPDNSTEGTSVSNESASTSTEEKAASAKLDALLNS